MMGRTGTLRPVGDPIAFSDPGRANPARCAPWAHVDSRTRFYGSGTAALAAVLTAARRVNGNRCRVIIPAYGCPALIAAIKWAGGEPVLVDVEPDSPWLDRDAVSDELAAGNVAAVIAVHFLGQRERTGTLARLCADRGVTLIEDSAQLVPVGPVESSADATVYSFGRGKPVSVMGGGAVVSRNGQLFDRLPIPAGSGFGPAARWRRELQALAHNVAIRPVPFGLLRHVPGLGIGTTRYEPLAELVGVDRAKLEALHANYARHRAAGTGAATAIREGLHRLRDSRILDLVQTFHTRPLRYPLLLPDRAARDAALNRMHAEGLGASAMYETPLPGVANMAAPVRRSGPFPNADEFAERLLTLPTHDGVTDQHVEDMLHVLAEACRTTTDSNDWKPGYIPGATCQGGET